MTITGIIPARYSSSRFPGKLLELLEGKPILQHVIEKCLLSKMLDDVIVATDDPRIAEMAKDFCRVEMTLTDHQSGTDRIAEVTQRCNLDSVVNIQGDEPMIDPDVIDKVAALIDKNEMSTAAAPIKLPENWKNPNTVKVVIDSFNKALYFSRHPIPYLRDDANSPISEQLMAFPFLKHIGIYGYQKDVLLRLVNCPVSPLEKAEKLEQLRALDNGISIVVAVVNHNSIGIDTPEDLENLKEQLKT
ncbi:MAG: 3-deoxy-manno-octulosonate cytidylyltransferase [Verrucomicrobiota bacterium]|nr:3-deoxy-manno-octulosonate cytidylyltransferase [Verrucomicrobiota bacterium]